MATTIPWRYTTDALPLDGQTVWIRRDAWLDHPGLFTFQSGTATFVKDIYTPLNNLIATVSFPAAFVLCWRFQTLTDQQAWENA